MSQNNTREAFRSFIIQECNNKETETGIKGISYRALIKFYNYYLEKQEYPKATVCFDLLWDQYDLQPEENQILFNKTISFY
jgi:hypothetical protein